MAPDFLNLDAATDFTQNSLHHLYPSGYEKTGILDVIDQLHRFVLFSPVSISLLPVSLNYLTTGHRRGFVILRSSFLDWGPSPANRTHRP